MSGLNTLLVHVRVMSCPGCVLSGLCLSGLCPCPGYVRVRVMSVSGLCLCPGYVLSGLCLSGLCPVRVVSVRVVSCPGCVCPGCVIAPDLGSDNDDIKRSLFNQYNPTSLQDSLSPTNIF